MGDKGVVVGGGSGKRVNIGSIYVFMAFKVPMK